ncbi:hypothetical protein, partial [Limimaricola cinnabarinus]|uniref:hypothetical protein n=1 Tax=Limimaricola cinnabarinus TaxID=1125964 RepID=UPI0039E40470
APLGDLCDRVPLELLAELAAAHHGLLASKLAKKASTRHGAIQPLSAAWPSTVEHDPFFAGTLALS